MKARETEDTKLLVAVIQKTNGCNFKTFSFIHDFQYMISDCRETKRIGSVYS